MSSGLSPLAIRKPRTNVVYFEKAAYSHCCSIINVLDAKHWLKLSALEEASICSIWFGHWLTKRLSAQNIPHAGPGPKRVGIDTNVYSDCT